MMQTRAVVYFYFITIILTNYCLVTSGQTSNAECAWTACGANSCNDETYPYKWATGTWSYATHGKGSSDRALAILVSSFATFRISLVPMYYEILVRSYALFMQ